MLKVRLRGVVIKLMLEFPTVRLNKRVITESKKEVIIPEHGEGSSLVT